MSATGRLLTAEQVAELMQVHAKWVYRAARDGQIPAVKLGRYWRFRPDSIDAFIEAREVGSNGKARREPGLSAVPLRGGQTPKE